MERFSFSQIRDVSMCGMYPWLASQGYPRKYGESAVVGIAAHNVIEDNLRARMNGGQMSKGEMADAVQYALDELLDEVEIHVGIDEDPPSFDEMAERALRFALMHRDNIAPRLRLLDVESRFDIVFPSIDAQVSGYIDVVEECDGGWLVIRDTKTTGKSPKKDAAERSFQLQLYGIAAERKYHRKVATLAVDTLVVTKTKAYPETSVALFRNQSAALLRVQHAIAQIRAGVPVPAEPDHWKCSDKWCEYYREICPFGARARSSATTAKE